MPIRVQNDLPAKEILENENFYYIKYLVYYSTNEPPEYCLHVIYLIVCSTFFLDLCGRFCYNENSKSGGEI